MENPNSIIHYKVKGVDCLRILFFLMNCTFLIVSFLMIAGATTLKVIFGEYYFVLWYSQPIDSLSSLWIATGCFLLALSIFGIAAAVKESTMLTNIYGIVLSLIFILQMAAAITAFALLTKSSGIVWQSLDYLMRRSSSNYGYEFRETMDWVQTNFQCCGNDGPSDWNNFEPFLPVNRWPTAPTTPSYPTYETDGYDPWIDYTPSAIINAVQQLDPMPHSCCTTGSGYHDMVCDSHFHRGCHAPLHAIVTESVMMIGSSALVIGVVQILGIMCAFMLARTIRRSKTHRDIQRWTIHQSMGFDRPAYVDQLSTPETGTDGVKQI